MALHRQRISRFNFVTDGAESALQQSRAAAGTKDVVIAGGGNVDQQDLRAGAIDELELHVVPIILGHGERLLANLDGSAPRLEQVRAVPGTGFTHLKYRILN